MEVLTVPYIEAFLTFGGIGPIAQRWGITQSVPHKFKHTGSYVYRALPAGAIETMVDFMASAPNSGNSVEFQALAGAVQDIPPEGTAYFFRNAIYNLQYKAQWVEDNEEIENVCWVESFRNTLLPFTLGDYVNFPDIAIKDYPIEYYETNLPRLENVKRIYDLGDVFHFEQSIPVLR